MTSRETCSAQFLLKVHQKVGALLVRHGAERIVWIDSFQIRYKMSVRLMNEADLYM